MKLINMKKHRILSNNDNASTTLIEALIAIGIAVSFMTLFFVSFNDIYNVYDRPDVDLQAKSSNLMETMLSFPGNPELTIDIDEILKLGTSPTVAYGIVYLNSATGEVIIIGEQYTFSNYEIGVIDR
jgi:hypothetical protein